MASSAASSSSALPTLSIPNISHLVSVKLSDTNYLVWESQVKPFLLGQNLWRFIDGSYPCPPQTVTPLSSTEKSPAILLQPTLNPDFTSWFQTDQSLVSILRATLSESVLTQVVGLSTSKAIWDCLSQNFSQQSLANETQLKFELFSITKGSKTVSAYLSHAKHLADQLAAINASVSNTDLVAYVLRGLGPDYQMLVTAILNFPPLPSFSDLRARLLAFEGQQALVNQMAPAPMPTAFLAASPRGHRYPRTARPKDTSVRSSPVGSPLFYTPGSSPAFPRPSRVSSLLGAPPTSRPSPQCWTCHQFGHIAARCPQSRPFAGMHMTSPSDPNWYFDSGATHHMTHDATSIPISTPSSSSGQVVVGNGASLPITQSGNVSFSSGSYVFRLSDVLQVPSLHKNLISVAQLTKDSHVSVSFFPWGYRIHDLSTGCLLFQGQCKNGLYPIPPTLFSTPKVALASIAVSSSLWHRRLGHPSNKVLRTIVSQSLLDIHSFINQTCNHCALAKSIRHSFAPHAHRSIV